MFSTLMVAQVQQKFRGGTGRRVSSLYPPVSQKLHVALGGHIGVHHSRGPFVRYRVLSENLFSLSFFNGNARENNIITQQSCGNNTLRDTVYWLLTIKNSAGRRRFSRNDRNKYFFSRVYLNIFLVFRSRPTVGFRLRRRRRRRETPVVSYAIYLYV